MDDKKRVCIGFIGAGKAGVSLGAYFRSKGLEISGYLSRSRKSAISAAELTSSKAFTALSDLAASSDMIIVSTPDGAIAEVWEELRKCDIRDRIVCHLSGSLSSDIFDGIAAKSSFGYSVHPMFAFSGKDGYFEGVEKACFTLEGAKEKLGEVREIFMRTGNRIFVIDKSKKAL
ncbi:MAG: NAD(P)-binding domain-containing protein, partial [Synergistaceae bacterium]|nr:NAD(P)-binding domain-containing protein [Synergistaceae bacterium]